MPEDSPIAANSTAPLSDGAVAAAITKSRIRTLMVSTSFPANLGDWRGLFIRHLADAFGRHGAVDLRLWAPPGESHPGVHFDLIASERRWLNHLMASGGISHLYRRHRLRALIAIPQLMLLLHRAYRRNGAADLFHVNWLQNSLPLPRDGKPLLVTVLGTDMQLLQLPLMRSLLRRTFRQRRVAICPNADWMVVPLREVFGDVADIEFLPFGIDPDWFRIDRNMAAPPARWVAVTRLTRNKLGPLFEWSAPLFGTGGRELHLFGPMQESIEVPDWVHYHGPTSPDILRDMWFPTATGLITLSRHAEGRPQVMLEAMAAGLPILASDIAAHASLLQHGRTGWLCGTAAQLGETISTAEDPVANARIGRAARDWAAREVGTWDDCAERYVRTFRRLLEPNPS